MDKEIQKKRKKAEEEYAKLKAQRTGTSNIAPVPVGNPLNNPLRYDLAPVYAKSSSTSKKKKEDEKEKEKSGWFKDSEYFDDGYDFGDITKTILGTGADGTEKFSSGFIGFGEKALDSLMTLGNLMNNQAMTQSAQDQMMFNAVTGKETDGILERSLADQRQITKETEKFIEKDLYDEDAIAKKIIANPFEKATGINIENSSVFDVKADSLMKSAGEMMASKTLASIPGLQGLGFVSAGLSSMGGEVEEALKQGATFEEATLSGFITGGATLGSGGFFNGVKLGGKTLTEGAVQGIARLVSGKTAQTLTKWGINTLGEGTEEVIEDFASAVGKKITYLDEEEFNEIFNKETAWESFLGGVLMGGAFEGLDIATNKITGNDYVTGLTKNEQKVVDKEVENRIAESEQDGNTLTKKDKNKIREDVLRDLDKGYISIDTIESVLGGETYDNYKSTVDREDALLKEFEELGERTNATLKEQARYKELEGLYNELKNSSQRSQLKSQLSDEVYNLAKNSRLAESYNERARLSEDFQADFSKFKGVKHEDAAKKTLENAIKVGANNTNRIRDLVEMNARVSGDLGIVFEYKSNEQIKNDFIERQTKEISKIESIPEAQRTEEQNNLLTELKDTLEKVKSGKVTVNGDITADSIVINLDSAKALNRLTGHEITHSLEKAKNYNELKDHLFAYAKAKGVDIDSELAILKSKYQGIANANPEAELVADLVGDYLFTDADFINSLSTEKPNVFKRIYNEIKYLCKIATAGSKEARELEKVKRAFDKAYKESANTKTKADTNTKFSLMGVNKDGIEVYETSQEIMELTWDERKAKYLDVMKNEYRGRTARFERNGHIYYAEFDQRSINKHIYGDDRSSKNGLKALTKAGADGDVFDLVENSQYDRSKKNTKKHTKADYFDYFIKTVQIDGKVFDLVADVEKTYGDNGGYVYSLALRDNKKIKVSPADGTSQSEPLKNARNTFFNDSLTDNGKDVKAKYSLSEEQETYFKDSKVRDENGNLKVMYHGTSKGGHTVFDTYGSNYGLFGQGSYFTDNKSVAESYTNKGKGNNKQVYESYLNITNPLDMDAQGNINEWQKAFPEADFSNCNTNEEFYRAVEEYYSDQMMPKWEVAETIKDSIQFNMGYDGITHIGGGRFNKKDDTRHQVYIAFEPEQIKNIDNIAPTKDADIRYSLSDSEGNTLSKGQQEYFKNSKAVDRNGNLLKVYHTTKNDFTVFDKSKKGEATEDANTYLGFFFTDDAEYMQNFPQFENGKTESYYLNMTNPIDMTDISEDAFLDIVEVMGGDVYEAEDVYREEFEEEQKRAKVRGDNNVSLTLSNLLDTLTGEFYYDDFIRELQPHYDELMSKGYDGVINYMDELFGVKEYVVLDSHQAKLTSNANPTEDADVRYSLTEQETQETNEKLNKVGFNYDAKSGTIYSLSSLEDAFNYKTDKNGFLVTENDYLKARNEYVDALAKSIAEEKGKPTREEYKKADRYLDSLFLVHDMIAKDKDRLDYEAAVNRSAWVGNVEYGGSIDFSTLCAKRRLFTGTFDAIQNALPDTVLTDKDFLNIRKLLLEHGEESPCSMCYVEGSRAKHGVYVDKWLKEYLKTNPEWKPQIADFTSTTRLEQTRIQHPEAYAEYVKAMNKLSQRKPKEASVRTDYKGEILDAFSNGSSVEEKNKNGGIRFNSFSDFEIIHALDCMQVLTDMARVGLNGQSYTKVKEFAESFGNTGLKINLSLVAKDVDANGKLVMDETNGMNYAEAMDIRNRYSDNVGTVIVVFNDEQLRAALADSTIDFVLPFHRSQWRKSQYALMGLPEVTRDYTNIQNDRYKNPKTGRPKKAPNGNIMPNEYWDFSLDGRANAQRYLDYINENSYIPKFDFLLDNVDGKWVLPEGAVGDGYFKLLIDFKMYNNEGVGSPQKPVLPEFNMPYIQQMLSNYVGGHQAFPVAHDVVSKFVEGKKKGTYSLSEEGETFRANGNFDVYGKDFKMQDDIAPTVSKMEQVAPVGVAKNTTTTEDIAPMQESVEDIVPIDTVEEVAPTEKQPIKTVKERLAEKIKGVETELANNKQLQGESIEEFNKQISQLQEEYAGKKNKNTKAANDILRRIERLQRIRDSVDADYSKRISDLENRFEKMNSKDFATVEQRKTKQQELRTQMEELVGDTSTWTDKKLGISYKVNTLKRNLRDIVRDATGKRDIAKADAIYEELQGKYNHNEAELNRESNRIKQQFAKMKITDAENTYIQMLGEFRHNPETTLTEDVVKEFYEKHKNSIDEAKVDKAIKMARDLYDDLLVKVNQVLSEQGMKEIPYRKGYFPHFTEDKQGILAKLLNWKTQNQDIPTDIAGLTENFKPNRSWQSFNKQRKSDITDYNFLKGLDTYVQGSLDWYYHIEDIQKRRAFENHIRYVHSEQGIKDKIEAIRNNDEYDAEEMQEQIDLVYREASNPLNNFVTDFRTATNTLAGKKSSLDRGMEEMTNRQFYSTMTNLSNRVSANMVGGSISSALTNFVPITQSWGQVSPISSLRAMKDTIASSFRDDGTIDKSDFLTNRLRKADNLYKTNWDKVGDGINILMDSIDSFTSQTVWRSKYLENISKGMSENAAIKDADQFAENVMAGRSRGNQPTIFDSKNPLTKIFTVFQLEVNNQYGYMFKDMPQDMANESKAKLVKGYATMFLGAYVYNALYSSMVGRDVAFDPIGIIEELLRDLGFGDDEEEEEIAPVDAIMNLTDNILEDVPFIGGLLGGGRIPISSALPYGGIYEAYQGTLTDLSEGNTKNLTKEWLNPIYYLAMPMGGGQIRKTTQGLKMFDKDLPVAGSYTDSGNLRFPVEDNLKNRVQAGVFGQWANENARDYFDNERNPLKEKQIQEFIDVDIPIKDYWQYREDLKGLDTLEEKFDFIADMDLPVAKKNILINNIVDRKEDVDLENYDDFANYEEFDFYTKNKDKYNFLQENNISYKEYKSSEEAKENYDSIYSWWKNNPEKVTVSKAVTDNVIEYRGYTSALNDIRADKDADGDSIRGSAKEKKKEYIWNLDIDDGAKYILFKSEYNADDTYNDDIVDYLNNRDDISSEEMTTILKELGATVDAEGYIYW